VAKTGKNQLDTYLDEPTLDIHFSVAIDVLEWWKSNNERFPDLALMARDLLSILITIVASESAFIIGSRILNKYRNCLLSTSVEAIICTSSWKHGFCDSKLFIIDVFSSFLFLIHNFLYRNFLFTLFCLKIMKTMTKIEKIEETCSSAASNDPGSDTE